MPYLPVASFSFCGKALIGHGETEISQEEGETGRLYFKRVGCLWVYSKRMKDEWKLLLKGSSRFMSVLTFSATAIDLPIADYSLIKPIKKGQINVPFLLCNYASTKLSLQP